MKLPLNTSKSASCRGIPLGSISLGTRMTGRGYVILLLTLFGGGFWAVWAGSGTKNSTTKTEISPNNPTMKAVVPPSSTNSIAYHPTVMAALADSDGDGIDDSVDLDDDNDGILDCNENLLNGSVDQFVKLNGSATKIAANEFQLTPSTTNQAGQAWALGKIDFTKNFSFSFDAYLGTNDSNGADGIAIVFHNDPAGTSASGGAGGGMGALGIKNGIVLELDTWNNYTSGGINDIAADHTHIWDSDNIGQGLTTPVTFSNLENGAWHPVAVTWNAATKTISYTVDGIAAGTYTGDLVTNFFGGASMVYFGYTASTGNATNDQRIRFTNVCTLPLQLDTDGDGIANQFDLDSDGDGCSDVIEGGSAFTSSQVGSNGQLTGSVDANGIPALAGVSGQNIGSSQNAGQQDDLCTPIDSDGDGVVNSADLDDDNDGILDCNENLLDAGIDQYMTLTGSSTKISATEIQLTPNAVNKSGNAYAKGLVDFAQSFSLSFDAFLGTNDATGADGIWAIFFKGTKGVVLELDTYDNGTAAGDIAADHTNIWDWSKGSSTGGGLTTPVAFPNLENGAWHPVVISWDAATKTLSYTVDGTAAGTYTADIVNTLFGGQSTMGFDFLANTGNYFNDQRIRITNGCSLPFQPDTDGDGIANQYDLDSDGDGCMDAIEGGATFTVANLSATGSLSGSVDANGVPTIAGAAGQTVGTSQNATQQDASCSVVATNDVATTTGTAVTIPILANDTDGGVPATLANVSLPTITSPPLAAQGTAVVNPDGTITFTPAPGYYGSAPFTYTICDKTNPLLCSVGRVNVQATCSQFSILVSEFGIKPDGTGDGTQKTEVLSGNANGATMKCTIPGGGGEGITINPATNLAYIASPAGYVQVYNYATGTIVKNINLTAQSGGILDVSKSADGAYIYISTVTGGVLKFSTATETVVATYPMTNFASGTTNLWGNAVNPITGNVYVSTGWWTQSGTNFKSIQYISPTLTGPATTFATPPAGYYYRGIVFDANGDLWALLSGGGTLRDRIMKYNGTTGAVLGTYDIPTPASYLAPQGAKGDFNVYDLDFGPDGNLYLSTYYGDCLTKFNVTTNTFSTYVPYVAGSGGKAFAFVCGDVQCPSGLLGGKVWVDANKDGQLNGTETVLANVTAQLYNATTNTLLANTTTDANGYYQFTTLPAGSYYVKFTTPSGYTYTTANVGVDATDSDANPVTGTTGSYTLTPGEANTTVYAGLIPQIVANPDASSTPLNTPVNISVLPNDNNGGSAPTASNVNITVTTPSPNGTTTINADGTITFTPTTGFVGTTTFVYTICEKLMPTNCDTALVTVTVGCPVIASPTLSATSKPNNCPVTTVDLSTITASNTPSGYTLGWFSSTPATVANRLTSSTALAAGTYYAAFYNATTGCYGSDTPVTATVVACCAAGTAPPALKKN